MQDIYILVINPGSTSTKISIFNKDELLFNENIFHSTEVLSKYSSVMAQYNYRKDAITSFIKNKGFDIKKLNCIVSRGGLTKPVKSGVYAINDSMLADLKRGVLGEHASNIGPMIAYSLASYLTIPSYVVDPVVVDELDDIARITGYKKFTKISIFHALNHKAISKSVAKQLNKSYEECNFVVAHMGGGISVGCHKKGRVVDVNNAFDGEGPFSPERTGTLPFGSVVDFCIVNKHLSKQEILKNFIGKGGLVSYLNTNSGIEIDKMINNGDKEAKLVIEAMSYNVAKAIVAQLIPIEGKCDTIILTGGLINWGYFVDGVTSRLKWLNIPIKVVAGEHEMKALVSAVLRVINKEEKVNKYK